MSDEITLAKSSTYRIVRAMLTNGNKPGVIEQWKTLVEAWALQNPADPKAQAVRAWLPYWQPREIYSVEELRPIMPALAVAMGFETRMGEPKSPKRLTNLLRFCGLPYRVFDDKYYFAVAYCHNWRDANNAIWLKEIQQ